MRSMVSPWLGTRRQTQRRGTLRQLEILGEGFRAGYFMKVCFYLRQTDRRIRKTLRRFYKT